MRILMLGWEYPPDIAGGLGVACEGLTHALAGHGHAIDFVVPQLHGREDAPHMRLHDSHALDALATGGTPPSAPARVERIPAMLQPYWSAGAYAREIAGLAPAPGITTAAGRAGRLVGPGQASYGADLFGEVAAYAERVLDAVGHRDFDVIHAHDWMTFPAGAAVAAATGRPLVIHVHSLEHDRAGEHGDGRIVEIERLGLRAATSVVAVSGYTRSLISRVHGTPPDRIHVVHNGVQPTRTAGTVPGRRAGDPPTVLFLGRVTFQKGPDQFVRAAAIVHRHLPEARFVVAGSGDMLGSMIERVHEFGLEEAFTFTGFLRGEEVTRAYAAASLYVMPSVSEPFGLTALEAVSMDVPVLLSRQSGVSEVVDHGLKFDFWDIERMADLMINGLVHAPLRRELVRLAKRELARLGWDAAAARCDEVYARTLEVA